MKNRLTLVKNDGRVASKEVRTPYKQLAEIAPERYAVFLCLSEYASNGVIYGGNGIIKNLQRKYSRSKAFSGWFALYGVLNSRHQRNVRNFSDGCFNQSGEVTMTTITILDLNTEVNHEPRILDVLIGEALGMAQPLDIRRTIEANKEELELYGEVFAHRPKTSAKGGRPSTEYYLNEPQLILLCMFSRTEKAAEVRRQVIDVFMDYRHGETKAVTATPKVSNSKLNLPAIISRLECAIMAVHEIDVCFAHQADALRSHTLNLRGKLEAITDLCGEPRRFIQAQILPAEKAKLLRRVA